MAKHLTSNKFAEVFLNDWGNFKYEIKYRPKDGNGTIIFEWIFISYSGHGKIDISNGELCNYFGNNYSTITLTSPRNLSVKHSDALYNDPDLAIVFENIIKGL